jgi:hypothetical protein
VTVFKFTAIYHCKKKCRLHQFIKFAGELLCRETLIHDILSSKFTSILLFWTFKIKAPMLKGWDQPLTNTKKWIHYNESCLICLSSAIISITVPLNRALVSVLSHNRHKCMPSQHISFTPPRSLYQKHGSNLFHPTLLYVNFYPSRMPLGNEPIKWPLIIYDNTSLWMTESVLQGRPTPSFPWNLTATTCFDLKQKIHHYL